MQRTKGGQKGNLNALKHGRYSAAKRAERRAARETEERQRKEHWPDIPIGYAGIIAAIKACKQDRQQ
jgi:hypothetical protein